MATAQAAEEGELNISGPTNAGRCSSCGLRIKKTAELAVLCFCILT